MGREAIPSESGGWRSRLALNREDGVLELDFNFLDILRRNQNCRYGGLLLDLFAAKMLQPDVHRNATHQHRLLHRGRSEFVLLDQFDAFRAAVERGEGDVLRTP